MFEARKGRFSLQRCRLKPIITWNNIYAEYVASNIEWKPSNKGRSEEMEKNIMQGNNEKLLNYSSRSEESVKFGFASKGRRTH